MESTSILSAVGPLILALMMLGLGLSLTAGDFKKLFVSPGPVLWGSALQILGLPIIGFILTQLFSLTPELAMGLMVLVACPGGPGSNMVSYLSRGDAALSVTLTAISSVMAIFSIPIVTIFAYQHFMSGDLQDFSIARTSIAIFLITLVPILVGMIVRNRFPVLADKAKTPVKIGSIAFLLLLVVSIFYKEREKLPMLIGDAGAPVLSLAIVTIAFGFIAGRLLGFSIPVQKTFAIELGIQNGALAIVIADSFLSSSEMAIPAALYSPVMITASLGFLIHAGVTRPVDSTRRAFDSL